MDKKIAVVTGANKGIGFEVARELAQKGMQVIATSRDEKRGEAACKALQAEKLDVAFRTLDMASEASIRRFSAGIAKEHPGGIDVLVNNAAVFLDRDEAGESSVFTVKPGTMRETFETNVLGPLLLIQALLPLLKKKKDARIINFSSGLGQIAHEGKYTAYRVSKVGINTLTRILAAELAGTTVSVNSMCPGWVRTDMGGPNAVRSVQEGADTCVWLATRPEIVTGKFFRDRKEINW